MLTPCPLNSQTSSSRRLVSVSGVRLEVGSSHDDEPGIERQRLRDLHHLLLGDGQLIQPRAGGDLEA